MMLDIEAQKNLVSSAVNYFGEMMKASATEVAKVRLDILEQDKLTGQWNVTFSYVVPALSELHEDPYYANKRVFVTVTMYHDTVANTFMPAGLRNLEVPTPDRHE